MHFELMAGPFSKTGSPIQTFTNSKFRSLFLDDLNECHRAGSALINKRQVMS
jgi:hypothetical protein